MKNATAAGRFSLQLREYLLEILTEIVSVNLTSGLGAIGNFLVFLYHMENLCWIFEIGHWGLGISALIVESLADV